jgi:hypothetical protein
MKNANEPAFPEPFLNDPNLALSTKPGLTKREYFAAMAMNGLLSNSHYIADLEKNILFISNTTLSRMCVRESIDMADELLKELEL